MYKYTTIYFLFILKINNFKVQNNSNKKQNNLMHVLNKKLTALLTIPVFYYFFLMR